MVDVETFKVTSLSRYVSSVQRGYPSNTVLLIVRLNLDACDDRKIRATTGEKVRCGLLVVQVRGVPVKVGSHEPSVCRRITRFQTPSASLSQG